MKKVKRILAVIASIVLVFVGLYLTYCVQFKWNFFGANFIQFRDILTLWSVGVLMSVSIPYIIYCYLMTWINNN